MSDGLFLNAQNRSPQLDCQKPLATVFCAMPTTPVANLWQIGDIPSDTASLAEPPYEYSNFDMLVGLALFVSSDISLILRATDAVETAAAPWFLLGPTCD